MTFRHISGFALAVVLIVCCGCGDSPAPAMAVRNSAPPKPAPPPSGDAPETPAKPGSEVPAQLGGPQFRQLLGTAGQTSTAPAARTTDANRQPSAAVDTGAPPAGQEAIRAEVGVGAQGKDYGDADAGLISVPISTYFSARELITFTINLPRAMNEFKVINNRVPKSQEEFDEKIIKEYNIQLPELHPGEKYWYNPKAGELMVLQPKPRTGAR